jgi:predicted short-subunit dehydrogenase-like oxidoreductase (DUF2520 family)
LIARLPRLSHDLGPVAAQSLRLASRIVNMLGAGFAVKEYAELSSYSLVLICVPAMHLDVLTGKLAAAMPWHGKTALLCDMDANSARLDPLRAAGASVGSMKTIAGFEDRFITEGDRPAMRHAARLAHHIGGRIEEVSIGRMAVYEAALSFSSSLFVPLMEASVECLLEAGFRKDSAVDISEALFQLTVRGYRYSGKRSWSGALASGDSKKVFSELKALGERKPLLAKYYRSAAAFALDQFQRHSALRRSLEP